MGSLSLRVRYRPVRIGWCVESQRVDQLELALRATHAFAGGRFNPVVPVDAPELAEYLVDRFRLDLLFPVADTEPITSFVKAHDYLHWPDFNKVLFHEAWQHVPPRGAFVDVYHAARGIREARVRKRKLLLPVWEDDDPLAMTLLAMFGRYPAPSSHVPDYEVMLGEILGTERLALQRTDPVPPELRTRLTPSRLTGTDLDADERGPDNGIYVGDADSFEDLLNFWNIRAAGAGLVFYDPRHGARLTPLVEAHRRWLASVPARPWQRDGAISIYRREQLREAPTPQELGRVLSYSVGPDSWNGLTRAETAADADAVAIGDSDDAASRCLSPAYGGARLRGVSPRSAHRTAPLGSRPGHRKSGQRFDPGGNLFSYALYLLAKWREPRAYQYVIRWLSLPEEKPFEIGGDIVTQDGARILAAVCDGDLTPITRLILNRDADQYGRGAGVSALALLAAWAEIPREPVVEYFLWLAEEGLEREPNQVWDSLVAESADIEALVVFPVLRRAYRDGLADPQSMSLEELAEVESAPPGRMLEARRERQPPIDDVAVATSWWSAFENNSANDALEDNWNDERQVIERKQPYRAPARVGRNEPCPCGTGKKFEKCCGR